MRSQTLGERESGTARLGEAVAAYRDALQEKTRARVPLEWAKTQNNLGYALQALGERESGTARLEEAVAAFRDALQENTRARVPLQWAATQNNLGEALLRLGERESGTTKLEEAAGAYREALEEIPRERVPLYWAQSTGNQGVALMLLAERRGDAETAKLAVQQIEAAFTASRDGGDAHSAAYLKRNCQKPAPLPRNSPSAEGSSRRIGPRLKPSIKSRRMQGKHGCTPSIAASFVYKHAVHRSARHPPEPRWTTSWPGRADANLRRRPPQTNSWQHGRGFFGSGRFLTGLLLFKKGIRCRLQRSASRRS